jgi:hypothetical protein
MEGNSHWFGVRHTCINGNLHKSNGPARIWLDGDWAWYLDGKDHRYYGPSCSFLDDWEIHGVKIT